MLSWLGDSKERESAIKQMLISTFTENLKEIQLETEITGTVCFEACDATNALCSILEAIFLHGVKNPLHRQALNAVLGDYEERQPHFWSVIMLFLNKRSMEQLQLQNEINKEIGQCRAWIRMILNESLCSFYLDNIGKSFKVIKSYYTNFALLRDTNALTRLIKLVLKLEELHIKFKLPINKADLNQWSDFTLQLAGLWTVGNILHSVSETNGVVDIAATISSEPTSSTDKNSLQSFEEHHEKVDLILQKCDELHEHYTDLEENKKECNEVALHKKQEENHVAENFSVAPTGVSATVDEIFKSNLALRRKTFQRRTSTVLSFYSMLNKYEESIVNPMVSDELFDNDHAAEISEDCTDFEDGACKVKTLNGVLSFENYTKNVSYDDFLDMEQHLYKLARERGLNSQGFQCKSCRIQFIASASKFRVCAFNGYYYCDDCMSNKGMLIPAKIVFNSDFRKYTISKCADDFLTEFRCQPLFDLQQLNKDIYNNYETMRELLIVRMHLSYLSVNFSKQCRTIFKKFTNSLYGKEHLYITPHRYSLDDFSTILHGSLVLNLQEICEVSRVHFHNCLLCQQFK